MFETAARKPSLLRRVLPIATALGFVLLAVVLVVRNYVADKATSERAELDRAIDAYYQANVKAALAVPAPEADHIVGRILPLSRELLEQQQRLGIARTETPVYQSVYTQLAPELRTERLGNATTIAIIAGTDSSFYVGTPKASAGTAVIDSRVIVTLFDTTTKRVYGQTEVALDAPPTEASREGLDAYTALLTARIAARLNQLPRR